MLGHPGVPRADGICYLPADRGWIEFGSAQCRRPNGSERPCVSASSRFADCRRTVGNSIVLVLTNRLSRLLHPNDRCGVIRYRGDPAASPAMSAVTPKADQVPHRSEPTLSARGDILPFGSPRRRPLNGTYSCLPMQDPSTASIAANWNTSSRGRSLPSWVR